MITLENNNFCVRMFWADGGVIWLMLLVIYILSCFKSPLVEYYGTTGVVQFSSFTLFQWLDKDLMMDFIFSYWDFLQIFKSFISVEEFIWKWQGHRALSKGYTSLVSVEKSNIFKKLHS